MTAFLLRLATLRQFPVRTTYCLALLGFAFLCYCGLRSVTLAYSGLEKADPIVAIQPRGNFMLPVSLLESLAMLPGVEMVTPAAWFGAYHQDIGRVSARGVDPSAYVAMFELEIEEATKNCFFSIRTAAIVTTPLSSDFDKVSAVAGEQRPNLDGSDIVLLSNVHRNSDGTMTWPFHVCGTFAWPDTSAQPKQILFNFEYLAEYSEFDVGVGSIFARTTTGNATSVAEAIDRQTTNADFPTISRSIDEVRRLRMRRTGDIALVAGVLSLSVFVAILFVCGALYAQSFGERLAEFTILHSIGYPRSQLTLFPFFESWCLTTTGCFIGIGLAVPVLPLLSAIMEAHVGPFELSYRGALESVIIATVASFALAAPLPLSVTRALAAGARHNV